MKGAGLLIGLSSETVDTRIFGGFETQVDARNFCGSPNESCKILQFVGSVCLHEVIFKSTK